MTRRLAIWLMVAAAAAAIVAFAPGDHSVVQPASRPQAAAPAEVLANTHPPRDAAPAAPRVLTIRPREAPLQASNPFPARPTPVRSVPSARPPAPPPMEAAPVPPPPPFQIVGRFVDDGREAVFVMHGEQTLVARVGDTLAGSYRVESMTTGALTLYYLPLQLRQTLPIPQSP